MRRSALLTLAVLGGAVSLIGGVALFASLTDTAKTGPITAESDALAGSADLKLTTATAEPDESGAVDSIDCDTQGYSDDLATDANTVSVTPGFTSDKLYFCIKNVGSQPVSLTLDAFEMVDVELLNCTGDESLSDPDCGIVAGAPGVGELSGVLSVAVDWYPQCEPGSSQQVSRVLKSLESTPEALVHGLSPGGAADCYSLTLRYPNGGDNTPAMIQAAQSDRVTWRFRFNASV